VRPNRLDASVRAEPGPGHALHLIERVADSVDVAGALARREGDANGLRVCRFAKRKRFTFALAPDNLCARARFAERRAVHRRTLLDVVVHVRFPF
jgi:hypothetical protein